MNELAGIRQTLLNRWTLQLTATVGLLAFAVGRVDLGDSLDAIRRADYAWAAVAMAILTGSKLLAAARWRLFLSRVGSPPLAGLMGAYVIGTMVNMLLPFRAGDFTKIEIISSRYGLPRAAISSSVFTVEAVLDAVTLLVLFLVSLVILDLQFVPNTVLVILIALIGGGFMAAVLTSRFMPREMPSWPPLMALPPGAQQILAEAWPKFLDGMFTLRDPRLLAQAFSLHAIEWLMRASVFWAMGASFALDEGPAVFLVLTIALALGTLFPITFLNFGTFQVIATEVLVAAGAPRGEAFGYALAAHALLHAWILVMGIVAMIGMQGSTALLRRAHQPASRE